MTKLLASAGKHGLKLFCPGFPGAQATQVCHNPASGYLSSCMSFHMREGLHRSGKGIDTDHQEA